jgi:hypothetical protein
MDYLSGLYLIYKSLIDYKYYINTFIHFLCIVVGLFINYVSFLTVKVVLHPGIPGS